MCYEIFLPKNFLFSGVGVGRYWQQRQAQGDSNACAGEARRGRAWVREHAGGVPGLPKKSVSGRSVGEKNRLVGTSNPSIVVKLLRNPPLQIMLAPILKIWLFGVLYSLLVSTLFSSTVFYHPIYKKDTGNRVCSPRGFRIPKGSSRK